MCNAYRHPNGCRCGFGPPYDGIEVEIISLAPATDTRTRRAANLRLHIPLGHKIASKLFVPARTMRVKEALRGSLQRIANRRFGQRKVRVQVGRLAEGSLLGDVTLVMIGVGVYHFFKDYEALKKGVKAFGDDVKSGSRYIMSKLKSAYTGIKRRISPRKTAQRSSKKMKSSHKDSRPSNTKLL